MTLIDTFQNTWHSCRDTETVRLDSFGTPSSPPQMPSPPPARSKRADSARYSVPCSTCPNPANSPPHWSNPQSGRAAAQFNRVYPECSTKRGARVVGLPASPVSPTNESAFSRAHRIHSSSLC